MKKQYIHPISGKEISRVYFSKLLRDSGGGRTNHPSSYWDSVDWGLPNRFLAKAAGLKKIQTVAYQRTKRGLPPDPTLPGRPKKNLDV